MLISNRNDSLIPVVMCKNDESSEPIQVKPFHKNNQAKSSHASISTILHYLDIIGIRIAVLRPNLLDDTVFGR